jgi:hypothetical protein
MLVELTRDRLLFDTISRAARLVDSGSLPHRQSDRAGGQATVVR